ncbi:MAG TPA: hypothetical protein VN047_01540 [Sphingopyxis sp.]|nr:hypothetical protein [Sphingopyxis sp.]HWW55553.1 hypothetical protein [Sphingopyxis sp.]
MRDEAKRKLREGIDPLAERKRKKLVAQFNAANTFGDIAKDISTSRSPRDEPMRRS